MNIIAFFVKDLGWISKKSCDFIEAKEETFNGRDVIKTFDGSEYAVFNMSHVVAIRYNENLQ